MPDIAGARRVFDQADQEAFAQLSGDRNPVHLDAVAARRLMFGRQVVHGVHLVCWALERHLAARPGTWRLSRLRADFRRPLGLGEPAELVWPPLTGEAAEIEITSRGAALAWLQVELGPTSAPAPLDLADQTPAEACQDLTPGQAATAQGQLALGLDSALLQDMFPHLAKSLPAWQTAVLLATTRLVGMRCPGLHSVYSSLDLAFAHHPQDHARLCYQVTRHEPALALLWIRLEGAGAQGTIKAFLRPRPRQQQEMEHLRPRVEPDEFKGQRCLVVGGSRGLGEVAAKLLALGGGQVLLTYHRGQEDAQRVVREIQAAQGQASCAQLDVLSPAESVLAALKGFTPNHLSYFATPFIAMNQEGPFSLPAFRGFLDFYGTGFLSLVEQALAWTADPLRVLYPSSVAVEDTPDNMREYAAAKVAGEAICHYLGLRHAQRLRLLAPRLPRLATDQMPTFLPVDSQDPVPVILQALRALQAS